MRLLNRKSQLQRIVDSVGVPSRVKRDLPDVASSKAMKVGLIAAGGLTGLTAGSARISSVRHQREEARNDS